MGVKAKVEKSRFSSVHKDYQCKYNAISRVLHLQVESKLTPFSRLNEAQNYVFANAKGLGIHELNKSRNVKDLEQWEFLINWLN